MDTPTEELVVLVDDHNRPIGTAPKADVHTKNTPLHRAFSVYVFNDSGEVLTQQRSSKKITWPLVWSNSCCGHVLPQEKVEDAVKRRVRQELSLVLEEVQVALPEFRYRAELDGIVENEICPVFLAKTEQVCKPNPSEIEQIQWVPWHEFVRGINDPETIYSPWAVLQVTELLASKSATQLIEKILE